MLRNDALARRHRAQEGEHSLQVGVSHVGERHERQERSAVARHAVTKAANQCRVAHGTDAGDRVARDVRHGQRAERAEIKNLAARQRDFVRALGVYRDVWFAVTVGTVRRSVHEIATALDDGSVTDGADRVELRG